VHIVPELDRLFRRLLGGVDPKRGGGEQGQRPDEHRDPPHRTDQPSKNVLDHASSCNWFISSNKACNLINTIEKVSIDLKKTAQLIH
jgi:hypothetical protein